MGKVTVIGATNTPSTALPLPLGDPILGVSTITNLNGSSIPGIFGTGLVNAGDSEQIATITFHKSQLVIGTFEFRVNTATLGDDIIALDGLTNLSATTIFNSAFLINVPEPGALSMLILGVGSLSLVGRGRRAVPHSVPA